MSDDGAGEVVLAVGARVKKQRPSKLRDNKQMIIH